MALATGLASFCFDLPLTVRSTFYPIFGEYVWGWLGDLLDSWSIVMSKYIFFLWHARSSDHTSLMIFVIAFHSSRGGYLYLTWTWNHADDNRAAAFGLD